MREEKTNVKGVVISDDDGLCMSGTYSVHLTKENQLELFKTQKKINFPAKGQLGPNLTGFVSTLVKLASQLEKDNDEKPTIVIDRADKRYEYLSKSYVCIFNFSISFLPVKS